jgi:hypothetical protein
MKKALEKVRTIDADLANRRLEDQDRELGGDGPHQIEAAIADALQKLR